MDSSKRVFLPALIGGVMAGILISIGGSVFLACENRVVGAILFSVALLSICYKEYILFTGKVGYMAESHTRSDLIALFGGLLGNLLTTYLSGLLIRLTLPALGETASSICSAKLTQSFFQTPVRGVFCGILMYLAVSIFKEKGTPLGILFCVPVFILSGFEHSIADMFYFGASGLSDPAILLFMVEVILGNTVGGLLLPLLQKANQTINKQSA